MAVPIQNVWHLRTVADTASKACYICYKPTTKVLTTPDNKDYFYICPNHLTDRGFASPIIDEAAEKEKQKRESMKAEIEKIKAEYEEKQRKKKAKKDSKKDDKDKDKLKDDKDEKERDEKIKSVEDGANTSEKAADLPRIYALHKNFYQMRLDRLRNIELARRNQQRMKDPTFFPTVPRGDVA